MRPVVHEVEDNSLSALSFDFLGVFPREKDKVALSGGEAGSGKDQVAESNGEAQQVESTDVLAAQTDSKDSASELGLSGDAAQPAEQTVVLAQGERLVRVVSAPRRHAWGAIYVLRTILVVLAVFCVGSLVLTMILNPELTFAGAVSLLMERASAVFLQIRELFA